MKNDTSEAFLVGIGAAAALIGLALLGFALGRVLQPDAVVSFTQHGLFSPGAIMLSTGAAFLLGLQLLKANR